MEIKFTCKTCESLSTNIFRRFDEFEIAGYESSIMWSEAVDGFPRFYYEDYFDLLDITPKTNEKRVIKVKEPFNVKTENHFWSFYQPAFSAINGLSEKIEEIDDCAFVKCKILRIISINDFEAWLQVQIVEVIKLIDAMTTLPQYNEKQTFWNHIYYFDNYSIRYKNWIFCEGNDQSNIGNWLIVYNEGNNYNLISFGEWCFHQDTAYLGNLKLTEETYSKILKNIEDS